MEEMFRNELMMVMGNELDDEQLRKLDYTLSHLMTKYCINQKETSLVVYDNNNQSIFNTWIATLRLEGKSEKTIDQYYYVVNNMTLSVGKNYNEITSNDIRFYLSNYEITRGVSKTSINNKRKCLSSFFSWLTTEEYIVRNPMSRIKKIKQPKVIKPAFSDENIESMRDNIVTLRDRALFELLLSTGCRVSEVVNMNMADINFNTKQCVVLGKGNKQRIVYISDKCCHHLRKYMNSRRDDNEALFLNRNSKRMQKPSIEMFLHNLGEKSNVENVHPHRFRRTFATNALNKGMDLQYVQKVMGHDSPSTTMIYCNIDDDNVKIQHKKVA